jgi:ribonuclease P/MRP protein subunit RPP40
MHTCNTQTLVNHLERINKMDDSQHGSRRGRSTLSQLLDHHYKIIKMLEDGDNVDSIYFDLARAFNKCDHGILLQKVKTLGITRKLGRWLHNFLSGRNQRVIVNGTSSASSSVTSGVPQGTVLGALLFLIYISDIREKVEAIKKIYVNETKVKKAIRKEEDVEDLQEDLERMYDWARSNNMFFNSTKFQVVLYGQNEDLKTTHYTSQKPMKLWTDSRISEIWSSL